MIERPPDWVDQGLCLTTDPELFFDKGQSQTLGTVSHGLSKATKQKRALAKEVCHSCPVMLKCREYYLKEEHGVFGGLDRDERRYMRLALAAGRHAETKGHNLGPEVFEEYVSGSSLIETARRYGMRAVQLRLFMEHFLTTPAGVRMKLEHDIKALYADDYTDIMMAVRLDIPVNKVQLIRRRLLLGDKRVSVPVAKLVGPGYDSTVIDTGRAMKATYLGESEDSPPWYFMQVKYPRGDTRRWVAQGRVTLGESVRRHVIRGKVVSSGKRRVDTERDPDEPAGEAAA